MATTDRDYAPKAWLDPVSEVEREALSKGFMRGVVFTVLVFLGTFAVMPIAEIGMKLLTRIFL